MRRVGNHVALLAVMLIFLSASLAQTNSQQGCKAPPPDAAHCKNKMKISVWTVGTHTPQELTYSPSGGSSVAVESKQFCFVRVTVCGVRVVVGPPRPGGPPAAPFITWAASRKYCGPIAAGVARKYRCFFKPKGYNALPTEEEHRTQIELLTIWFDVPPVG